MANSCAVALKVLASFKLIEETICSSMCAWMSINILFHIIHWSEPGNFGCGVGRRCWKLEVCTEYVWYVLSPGTNRRWLHSVG